MHSKQAPRRRHDAELKARVVAACNEPGASVAAVAHANDLNANLVHKWRRDRGAVPLPAAPARAKAPEFLAVSLPAPAAAATAAAAVPAPAIRVELRRGATTVSVNWPLVGAADCAAWLRELCRQHCRPAQIFIHLPR